MIRADRPTRPAVRVPLVGPPRPDRVLGSAPVAPGSRRRTGGSTDTRSRPGRSTDPAAGRPAPPPGAPHHRLEALDGPAGRRSVRFSYHATGATGADVAVSGVLVTPTAAPPDGGFPLISWAHPTTGAADGCQPSIGGTAAIPELDEIIGRGWAVVATDYEGLGSAGPHPYLVGDRARATPCSTPPGPRPAVPGSGVGARRPRRHLGLLPGRARRRLRRGAGADLRARARPRRRGPRRARSATSPGSPAGPSASTTSSAWC